MKMMKVPARHPLALALGAIFAASLAQPVLAQEEAEDEAPDQVLDRVQVTGSLIKRLQYESVSPVQVISADTSRELGQMDTADMLQQSSVAAGSTQITNQFSGFVVEGGTGVQTISLRGLGANRTLVLLDGRRPGPAGTRGQVGAFDLNVIPADAIQRFEILKDGASSIYGSDAVAGVINIITRKGVDRTSVTVNASVPFESGGDTYSASGVTGWNFENGNVMLSFAADHQRPLNIGDRDFFNCPQDLFTDANGNSIDRQDRSILAGTDLGGCSSGNLYANTVIDAITGVRYIPAPDGNTIGLIPGYRPRVNPTYANSPQAAYEDVLNFDFFGETQVIDRQKRQTFYGTSDFEFGDLRWNSTLLINNRSTETRRFRQFFPVVGGSTAPASFRYANSPSYQALVPSGVAQPIMPFRSNQRIDVDYRFLGTSLEGVFPGDKYWTWRVDGTYSRSDGDYNSLGIVASRSGDVRFDTTAPRLDYFSPRFLSGQGIDELEASIGAWDKGNTIYDQTVFNALATGDLFSLPGGIAGAAVGFEHRRFSIDDQPGALSRGGDLWGQSSAQVTKGKDNVSELFAELEMPLFAGLPAMESFTVNASARTFKYDSISDTESVWKYGFSWQLNSSLRLRGTRGTSFRAPGLFELFLGDQTAFVGQLAIDPCINWGESTNDFIRANCGAEGIPANYAGGASSATVISSGGAGLLNPETSKATTVGLVFTPTFADFSMSLDYFEIQVNDQIAQLGSGAILGGCYGAPVFPNAFCGLFIRNPADAATQPFAIQTVRSAYLNVNLQRVRGYDLLFRFEREFGFGNYEMEGQFTYTMEDISQLFNSAQASGFDRVDRNGDISRPKLVGTLRNSLRRGDWSYNWFMNYVDSTQALDLNPETTYSGFAGARRDIVADSRLYHTLSVRYGQDDWDLLVGVNNVLDKDPPSVSSGVATRYGNTPAFATQYDWLGRRLFARFTYRF